MSAETPCTDLLEILGEVSMEDYCGSKYRTWEKTSRSQN